MAASTESERSCIPDDRQSLETGAVLPRFEFVDLVGSPLVDGPKSEGDWMRQAARTACARAYLWESQSALVVPRSYERAPRWVEACDAVAGRGWAVQVRASGGGLVPQGTGVWNLSLLWRSAATPFATTEAVYRAFCAALAAAFARVGLAVDTQAVEGSFCDGRFNLAAQGAKLVGTAQSWRRIEGVPVVLTHAVIVVGADAQALTELCNDFEGALGHERRYRPQAMTSLAAAWEWMHAPSRAPADLGQQFRSALAAGFSRR